MISHQLVYTGYGILAFDKPNLVTEMEKMNI